MSQELIDAITEMREEDALQIATDLLDAGTPPLDVLDDCKAAMAVVGKRFETGESFIPELMLAGEMLAMYGGVSALQLAPSGVIRHIVPLVGHELALGHNLLDDPERNKEAFLALKSRTLTLAGPFELRQGGAAVVGRLQVFLQFGKQG